jgi:hypothetical protein
MPSDAQQPTKSATALAGDLVPEVCVGCRFVRPFYADFQGERKKSEHYGLCLWWSEGLPMWVEDKWVHGMGRPRDGALVKLLRNSVHTPRVCGAREPAND